MSASSNTTLPPYLFDAAKAAEEDDNEKQNDKESLWNLEFLRTTKGMLLVAQVLCSIVGGIVNFYHGGMASGLLNFAFWSTTMLSSLLLAIYVCKIDASFDPNTLWRLEVAYVVVWTLFYVIGSILSFVHFGISAIFAYVILLSFIVDLLARYHKYRTKSPPDFKAKNPIETVYDPPRHHEEFSYA